MKLHKYVPACSKSASRDGCSAGQTAGLRFRAFRAGQAFQHMHTHTAYSEVLIRKRKRKRKPGDGVLGRGGGLDITYRQVLGAMWVGGGVCLIFAPHVNARLRMDGFARGEMEQVNMEIQSQAGLGWAGLGIVTLATLRWETGTVFLLFGMLLLLSPSIAAGLLAAISSAQSSGTA